MRTITLDLERMTSVPELHKYLRSAQDEAPRPVLRIAISLLPVKFRFLSLRPATPAAAARHTSPAFHYP